jgi:alkylation response protein AidB-like acyl-CoA dehydrogenase
MPSSPHHAAARLEAWLGDPRDPAAPFSFARAVELDEAEAFPEDACRLLAEWGIASYFVPPELGGALGSFEELLLLVRAVSRRDLTVAIAMGQTYLGAVHVWIAGSPEQRRRVADLVLANRSLAFALTERDHGGDVLANEVRAEPADGGYRLHGEKWLINNGTRGAALTVFARTDPRGGPTGFSLVLFERERSDPTTFASIPRVRTLGLRGADISGIRFDGCPAPAGALVGQLGRGFETALRGLMVTRALCAGFSLGAGDTALRSTLAFASRRRIYGDTVLAIPHARDVIADAFADLLVADAVASAPARGLHLAPGQVSVWSAVTKYVVPVRIEAAVARLATVLGARYYLREEHEHGTFQKLSRDNAVVGLFDGSTAVNLGIVTTQLGQLLRAAPHADAPATLAAVFGDAPLGVSQLDRLALFNGGRDDVVQGLTELRRDLAAAAGELDEQVHAGLTAALEELLDERASLGADLAEAASSLGGALARTGEAHELSRRYALLFAGAAALHRWRHARADDHPLVRRGDWLVLGLARLLAELGRGRRPAPRPVRERVAADVVALDAADRAFALAPLQLGRGAGAARAT